MRRREFIAALGSWAAMPLAARAQQPAMPVIGFLNTTSAEAYAHFVRAFRQSLSESGFVDGRNAAIEYRWAESHLDRLPGFAQHRHFRFKLVPLAMELVELSAVGIVLDFKSDVIQKCFDFFDLCDGLSQSLLVLFIRIGEAFQINGVAISAFFRLEQTKRVSRMLEHSRLATRGFTKNVLFADTA